MKLGRGSDIQILSGDNSYSDINLPFDFHQLPDFRKEFLPDDLIEPFHQQQCCAPTLRHKTDSSFKSDQILPITAVEKLGDGGSAVVYKIKIHEAYDELVVNRGRVIVKHLYVFIRLPLRRRALDSDTKILTCSNGIIRAMPRSTT